MNLKAKIIIPVTLILLLIMAALAIYNYVSETALITDEAESLLREALISAHNNMRGRLENYQEMAALVASMPTVADAFAKGDRERLVNDFSPGFESLKKAFKVAQFQFHKPPAFSFLRLHMPGKYGDDLSSFRNTVLFANNKKAAAGGVEVGRGGIGLRGVEPVFSRGGHAGSVEFGGDIISPVDEVKKTYGVEVGILLTKEATAIVWEGLPKNVSVIGDYASLHASDPDLARGVLSPEILAGAKKAGEKMFTEQGSHQGKSYDIALSPLVDYNGKTVGFIYALRDRTPLLNKSRVALVVNIAISLLVLALIIFAINVVLKRTVLDPVFSLVNASEDISMGKLDRKVEIEGAKDEIAILAKSIDRMRISMKKLLE